MSKTASAPIRRLPANPRSDRKLHLGDELVNGTAYTRYSPQLAERICQEVAAGRTLADICSASGMPAATTFLNWTMRYPELAVTYEQARAASAIMLEEEALGAARQVMTNKEVTGTGVRAVETGLNQLRWSASKRDPKRFGQQAPGAVTIPIQINTTLDLGNGPGGPGALPPQAADIYTISASVQAPGDMEDPLAQDVTDFGADEGPSEVHTHAARVPYVPNVPQASIDHRKFNKPPASPVGKRGPGRPKKRHKSEAGVKITLQRRAEAEARRSARAASGGGEE